MYLALQHYNQFITGHQSDNLVLELTRTIDQQSPAMMSCSKYPVIRQYVGEIETPEELRRAVIACMIELRKLGEHSPKLYDQTHAMADLVYGSDPIRFATLPEFLDKVTNKAETCDYCGEVRFDLKTIKDWDTGYDLHFCDTEYRGCCAERYYEKIEEERYSEGEETEEE